MGCAVLCWSTRQLLSPELSPLVLCHCRMHRGTTCVSIVSLIPVSKVTQMKMRSNGTVRKKAAVQSCKHEQLHTGSWCIHTGLKATLAVGCSYWGNCKCSHNAQCHTCHDGTLEQEVLAKSEQICHRRHLVRLASVACVHVVVLQIGYHCFLFVLLISHQGCKSRCESHMPS